MVNLMKNMTIPLLIAGLLYSAQGHGAQDEVDAVGKWLNERTMRAALEDSSLGSRRAEQDGTYRIIRLSELDAPEEVKQHFRAEMARNAAGVKHVPNGEIPSQATVIASLPRTVRSNAELRGRLPSPPTDLQGTMLGAAELIGMEPSGALDGLKSSGLTRFYRLKGVGIVEFNEDNYRTPGTSIEVIAELQNARVNGAPAKLEQVADERGRSRATLVWAGDSKVYTLIATGDGDVAPKAAVLQQIAAAVRD
jgi:hypothetical protein